MLADDEGQVSYTKFMEGARGETERASDDLSNELSGQFCPRQAFCTFFKYLESSDIEQAHYANPSLGRTVI